ncbi:MAG: ATP-binding protein [Azospirillaceae bacterium]|nr:ATP-binding protein [Azospirillaceae bacterium]
MTPSDRKADRRDVIPIEIIFEHRIERSDATSPAVTIDWPSLLAACAVPEESDIAPILSLLKTVAQHPDAPATRQWLIQNADTPIVIATAIGGEEQPQRLQIGRSKPPPGTGTPGKIGSVVFQEIIDLLPATISIKDRDRRYLFVNHAWEVYAGISRAAIIGRRHEDIDLKPIDPANIRVHTSEVAGRDNIVLNQGIPLINQEESYRAVDGSQRTLLSTKIPLVREDETVSGVLSITFDITDRKRMELELQAEHHKAEAANQAKSEFLATISHEIRTPMNGLIGALMLIEQDGLSVEQNHMHRVARDSADALMSLLDDLLDFAKLEAGKVVIEPIDFSLDILLNNIVEFLRPRARSSGLELTWSITPDLPPLIRGDPARLRQILLNLIGNAIKFTVKGSVAVRARRGVEPEIIRVEPGDQVRDARFALIIEVEDTGIGIPPEAFPRLFQRFSQVDSSTTRRYGGNGLGLAICKQLCELMGGTIEVESEMGHGSTFRFTVPVTAGDPVLVTDTVSPTLTATAAAGQRDRSLRVLVVEDNIVNRDIIRILLGRAGHDVAVAGNGVEAVALVRKQHYDVVLMDIEMPEMDGVTAVRLIRTMPEPMCRTPVVALTAHASPHHRQEYLAAGMTDYLTKPIHPKKLWATLQAAAGKRPVETAPPSPVVEPLLDTAQATAIAAEQGLDHWHRLVIAFSRSANQLLAALVPTCDGARNHRIIANSIQAIAANLGARRLGGIAKQLEQAERIGASDINRLLEPLAETIAALGSIEPPAL